LAVNTLIVFGYTIRNNPRSRKVLSFWALIIVILFVHLLFFSLVLEASEQWKLGWWVLVAPIEYLLIGLALGLVRPHRRSHSN
jgi:lipopolysaccharide export LptBFGC system permease protein LptF